MTDPHPDESHPTAVAQALCDRRDGHLALEEDEVLGRRADDRVPDRLLLVLVGARPERDPHDGRLVVGREGVAGE
jgi:hypothetical protein